MDRADSIVGKRVGRYDVLRLVGRGGMGEVYLAQDTSLGRKVALKLLRGDVTDDLERVDRFRQEARAASALNHPNILTIYEIGQDTSLHFIATEYVEGETLRAHLARGRMPLSQLLDVAVQAASALAAAHEAGIIHRDIKPANVMLRTDGYVKVVDFGLAKLTESTAKSDSDASTVLKFETQPGAVMGTVSYMSPEQARGLEVDARADVWSLGALIYEMAAGCRPFESDTSSDVMALILQKDPPPLAQHALDVPAELERIVRKALRKDKEERYQTAKDLLIDLKSLRQELDRGAGIERARPPARSRVITQHKRAVVSAVALVLTASIVFFLYFNRTKAAALTEKDTILLADIENTTGDPVFDGALKEALAIQLEQSPFLNLFPEDRVRQALTMMGRPQTERVTKDVAREICQREGLKAMLAGSISSLGSHYVIGLDAVNAQTGEVMAREQTEADSKEQVLKTLGASASKLREKLGESLASIQKFNVPLAEATTSSLEALRAFSLGEEQRYKGKEAEAVPFYRRATESDQDFASAYRGLSVVYGNIGQSEPAIEFAKKAFELRDRVTERERYAITWTYYSHVTLEWDKSLDLAEVWKRTYPRDFTPHSILAVLYARAGQYEKAVAAGREGLGLNPNVAILYGNLAGALRALGRYDEAKATLAQAFARNLDLVGMHSELYMIAFAEGNTAEMARQFQWASGKPREYVLRNAQSDTEAFAGHFRQARVTIGRAAASAQAQNLNWFPDRPLMSAVVGSCQQARTEASSEIARSRGGPPKTAVLALALCGDAGRAQSLVDEMARRGPTDPYVNAIWIPAIRAAIETGRRNSAQALQFLEKARPYEMGWEAPFVPTYVRGQAYLSQGSATEAMAEFQKIIDRRGVSPADVLYPLAYLQLARAAALAGDIDKSRKAYEQFFALWKDADPDIPVLIEAKKEYAKLK